MTSISSTETSSTDRVVPVTRYNWLDKTARAAVLANIAKLPEGRLTITDALGSQTFTGSKPCELSASVHVTHPRFYRRAVTAGSLGIAQSFIDGEWTCDDLTSFFRIFVRGTEQADQMERGLSRMGRSIGRIFHKLRKNTRLGSKKNIHEHYDLGNEFFALFLDETMSYSCAFFDRPEMTLQEASISKLDRVCKKLDLKPTDHLIEIGTGWGGLSIHAARNYGCRVTTTTISQQQYDEATRRIAAAGLTDKITVLLEDYRDLKGQYDKLVSIEMIEAVGHEFLPTYFAKCSQLIKPDGVALIQAITMPDHRYAQYLQATDFIQRFVFPGSCVPSVTAISDAFAKASDFRLVHLEEIGTHYVATLQEWRKRFSSNIEHVKKLGYPDRFLRMWDYYLCYCEAGFAERYVGDVQILLSRPAWRGSPQIGF